MAKTTSNKKENTTKKSTAQKKSSSTKKTKNTEQSRKENNTNSEDQDSQIVHPNTGETVSKDSVENTTQKKLTALYTLQQLDTQIDKIRIIRGELPLEVQDLEDEIEGMETRTNNYKQEIEDFKRDISNLKNSIKESQELIKKYESQQMNVRNNREYDSLSKEIEYQNLEIQLNEKKIKDLEAKLEQHQAEHENSTKKLEELKGDLEVKKKELDTIIADTQKEENMLLEKSKEQQQFIEERLLNAYKRIRENAKNGLAVVPVERNACGGCFNKIPPQRQLDIQVYKKIIVCEYCGRILVDDKIVDSVDVEKVV